MIIHPIETAVAAQTARHCQWQIASKPAQQGQEQKDESMPQRFGRVLGVDFCVLNVVMPHWATLF
jgi:hypothetical protein